MTNSRSTLLLLCFGLVAGIVMTKFYYTRQNQRLVESSVLLEQIKAVTKLVSVEGSFSELMVIQDNQGPWDFFWGKKAIIQVNARVSAGYDLNLMQIDVNKSTQTVRLSKLPKATILSIDPQLSYYDITEGLFVSFSPQDYTDIQGRARAQIEAAAIKSNLLPSADAQAKAILMSLKSMIEHAGWRVETDFAL